MRRRPWLWTAAIVLLDAMVWSTGIAVFADTEHATWADWVAAGFIAYGVIGALVLVPRVIVPRARVKASENRLALMRLAFAQMPFLFGFAALGVGAHAWIADAAFLVTALLLVSTAIAVRD